MKHDKQKFLLMFSDLLTSLQILTSEINYILYCSLIRLLSSVSTGWKCHYFVSLIKVPTKPYYQVMFTVTFLWTLRMKTQKQAGCCCLRMIWFLCSLSFPLMSSSNAYWGSARKVRLVISH